MKRIAEAPMEKAAELEKKTINPEFDYCRDRIVCQDSRRDRQVVAYSLPERRENRRSRDTAEKPGTLPVFFLRKMREVSRVFPQEVSLVFRLVSPVFVFILTGRGK